jgi:tetratricopeptide (TPR) repeat protein
MNPLSLLVAAVLFAPFPAAADSTLPTAAPAKPLPAATVKVAVTALVADGCHTAGVSNVLDFRAAKSVVDVDKLLDQMRDQIAKNAVTDEFRSIGAATVDKIKGAIKTDADVAEYKAQLSQLPEMMGTQIASDQFRLAHDMSRLSPADAQLFDALRAHYDSLMPTGPQTKQPPSAPGPGMDGMSGMVMPPATGPKRAPVPIMSQFHVAYQQATDQWNETHAAPIPAPTPVPGPGPFPAPGGGTGGAGPNGPAPGSNVPPPGFPPIDHINNMIASDPSGAANWQLRARYELQTGKYAAAQSDAEKALSLGGGVDARVALGEADFALGDKPAAYDQARAALQSDPSNARATALLHFAEPFAKVSAPKAAGFAETSAGSPGASAGTAGKGSLLAILDDARAGMDGKDRSGDVKKLLAIGDVGGALALANAAIAANPNDPTILALRSQIYLHQGDYDKAFADAAAGLKLAPGNHPLLTIKGRSQLRLGRYQEALQTANEMLSANPNDAGALALRAHAYGSLGNRDAMLADIDRAAALDPKFKDAAASMEALVRLPNDQDVLFLFPGEAPPSAAPSSRGGRFGLLTGLSLAGGLLLAAGLLSLALAPLKEKAATLFTRAAAPGTAPDALETAQPASAAGLLPGVIRGQYEITRKIGEGGMGTVFEGKDRSLGRRVAIKKMRDELRGNPRERARFVIEAKTVAALRHPGIVDIYAIAEEGLDVFLVFEYVDGPTVHELIQRSGRLSIAESARVVRASADALGFAHGRGVIHRDMKPSNVMLDAAGRVKVMDFGIARMAKDAATRYSMTNTVIGTPPYMAPEQEQGHVRRESDVYALAVCAYEMLTGKLPFVGLGAGMLMNKINMKFVPPSHAIAGMPEGLDAVFAKAFQADPDARYRTPQEFADALEAALPAGARA